MNISLPLPSKRPPNGFTLIEVTIALGICATVMIALLGLLPLSLDQMRESRNLTSMARITEDIINDIQLMEWADRERLDGEKRDYDDQGTRIQEIVTDANRRVYTAEIEIDLEGVFMPGQSEVRNDYAQKVTLYVGPSKGENVNLKLLAETDDRYKKFTTIIARLSEQKDPNEK